MMGGKAINAAEASNYVYSESKKEGVRKNNDINVINDNTVTQTR